MQVEKPVSLKIPPVPQIRLPKQTLSASPAQHGAPEKRPVQEARLHPALLEVGQAFTHIELEHLSEETKKDIAGDVIKTVRDESAERLFTAGVPLAKQTLQVTARSLHSTLGQRILSHSVKTLGSAVPLAGSLVSVKGAIDSHQRACKEENAGHHLAARAFQTSAMLSEVDATAGIVSAGASASLVGVGVAVGAEVTGWVVSGVGLFAAIGGEILSDQGR